MEIEYTGKESTYTGKELKEAIVQKVKEGIIQERNIYKYLGTVINKSGNLKDHILELRQFIKDSHRFDHSLL